MKIRYKPENFVCMRPHPLVKQLDYLLKDPLDQDYLIRKGRLIEIAIRLAQADWNGSYQKKSGNNEAGRKNLLEIAEYYECSASMVHKARKEIGMCTVRK